MTAPQQAVQLCLRKRGLRHVLIACSGGPDSLALAWLAAEFAAMQSVALSAAVVDHGAQQDSGIVAREAMRQCASFGIANTFVLPVRVQPEGDGFEAAARRERRKALKDLAEQIGADEIWLAHTLEDQAETVLIGLTHGSGARSLSGMPHRDGVWVRPLLGCRRHELHAVLPSGIQPWTDPHNADTRFLRVQVRSELMPAVVHTLGDKAVVGLARTAEHLARDNDALDALAATELLQSGNHVPDGYELRTGALSVLHPAVVTRVLRGACMQSGVTARDLTMAHLDLLSRFVTDTTMRGPVALPGLVSVERGHERLVFRQTYPTTQYPTTSDTSLLMTDEPGVAVPAETEE